MKKVNAESLEGYSLSLSMMFGISPMFRVKCGECGFVFKTRFVVADNPCVPCKHCKTMNELPLTI